MRIPTAAEWAGRSPDWPLGQPDIPGFGPPHNNPQPGDVVSDASHMGIQDKDGIIQAPSTGAPVYTAPPTKFTAPYARTPIAP